MTDAPNAELEAEAPRSLTSVEQLRIGRGATLSARGCRGAGSPTEDKGDAQLRLFATREGIAHAVEQTPRRLGHVRRPALAHLGEPGEAKRERRAHASARGRAASSVRPHDLVHDGKAEPRSSLGAGSRGVRTCEAVENQLERVRREATALICDLDHQIVAGGARAERA